VKLETLTQVNAERAARRPVIVITDTANGEQRLVKAKDIATDPLRAELSKQLRMGKSGTVEAGGKKLIQIFWTRNRVLLKTPSISRLIIKSKNRVSNHHATTALRGLLNPIRNNRSPISSTHTDQY